MVKRASGNMRLGKAIAAALKARGLTPTTAAFQSARMHCDLTGRLSRSEISQWIHGLRAPSTRKFALLAEVLDCDFVGTCRVASAHHEPVVCADMAPLTVTCRSTGNVLYSDATS